MIPSAGALSVRIGWAALWEIPAALEGSYWLYVCRIYPGLEICLRISKMVECVLSPPRLPPQHTAMTEAPSPSSNTYVLFTTDSP